jgi:hypothetical protein
MTLSREKGRTKYFLFHLPLFFHPLSYRRTLTKTGPVLLLDFTEVK